MLCKAARPTKYLLKTLQVHPKMCESEITDFQMTNAKHRKIAIF